MEGSQTFKCYHSFLPDQDTPVNMQKLKRRLVFVDDIFLLMTARRWFQEHLPQHLRDHVQCYNLRCGVQSKFWVLTEFECGNVDILFASEAAGMVRPNINL